MAFLLSVVVLLFAALVAYYFMLPHGPELTKHLNETYDYIIVGAGSAGATLAARLSEQHDITVLLLEAGGTPEGHFLINTPIFSQLQQNTKYDWAYRTVPQKYSSFIMENNSSAWPRGKVLGGSSCLNLMVAIRGNRHDYDNWAKDGCTGWSYKDVLPYFIKMENVQLKEFDQGYRGSTGPVTITAAIASRLTDHLMKAGVEMGYKEVDCNGKDQIGMCRMQSTIEQGRRASTYWAYLRQAIGRPNLHVAINSMVTKVNIENKRAVSVNVLRDGKTTVIKARKEIISSGGAINSPQLLMLSGIGPKEHLQEIGIDVIADLPVGNSLQDHLFLPVVLNINDTLQLTDFDILNPYSWYQYLVNRKGPLAATAIDAHAFFYNTEEKQDSGRPADLQIHFFVANSYRMLSRSLNLKNANLRREVYDKFVSDEDNARSNAFVPLLTLLHPKSQGTIRLRSADPLEHPLIDPNYLSDKADVQMLRSALEFTRKYSQTPTMQSLGVNFSERVPRNALCSHLVFDTDEFWECYIRNNVYTVYHPTSTCRMGGDQDPTTVVDTELRVKGIHGLRVVDASVMRDVPSGNTNLPTIMIAEKAADFILQRDSVSDIQKSLNNIF